MVGLVILAGGIVRATGSGMGCPDWPRCFGLWVPPTEVSQLPDDYQTRYNVHGHGVEPFNVYKTWTEYLNRLLGAATGLCVLIFALTGLFSGVRMRAKIAAVAALALMALQGLLGARVVDSNLAPFMVTVHMVLALVILLTLMAAVHWQRPFPAVNRKYFKHALVLTAMIFVQTALGTRVRELVDEQTFAGTRRDEWIEGVGILFYVHRSFSLLILGYVVYLLFGLRKEGKSSAGATGMTAAAAAGTLLGATMYYGGFPAWAQPLHLVSGAALSAATFYFLLQTTNVDHHAG
jgi:cytochrome c oxidase assembly protein subunit 15